MAVPRRSATPVAVHIHAGRTTFITYLRKSVGKLSLKEISKCRQCPPLGIGIYARNDQNVRRSGVYYPNGSINLIVLATLDVSQQQARPITAECSVPKGETQGLCLSSAGSENKSKQA